MLLAFLRHLPCHRQLRFLRTRRASSSSGQLMPAVVDEPRLASSSLPTARRAAHLHRRVSRGLRGQGPAGPVPHLATLRLRGSASRHYHPAHRRHVEDGSLRLPAYSASHLQPTDAARPHSAALWLAVATIVLSAYSALAQRGPQAHLRVLLHQPPRLLHARPLCGREASPEADAALTAEKYAAMSGVFLQMFNHGLTASALFWFVAMLEKRTGGLRGLDDFGGLRKVAPVFTGLMGIALFSSLGLPGLNGFIGEFLIFKGSFPLVAWATSLAVLGLLTTALFTLGILQRVFSGPLNEKMARVSRSDDRRTIGSGAGDRPDVCAGPLSPTGARGNQQYGNPDSAATQVLG
jgi:hypothetical protein